MKILNIWSTVVFLLFIQEIPDPQKYFLTRWYSDPHTKMSYSYIPVDAKPDAYEVMGRDVEGKLFFAGEVSRPHSPPPSPLTRDLRNIRWSTVSQFVDMGESF